MAEEIDLEKCDFQNFKSPVTFTLDRVILHTVVHPSLTSISYIPNFIEIEKNFLWTDGHMDVHTVIRMDVCMDIPTDRHFIPHLMLLG